MALLLPEARMGPPISVISWCSGPSRRSPKVYFTGGRCNSSVQVHIVLSRWPSECCIKENTASFLTIIRLPFSSSQSLTVGASWSLSFASSVCISALAIFLSGELWQAQRDKVHNHRKVSLIGERIEAKETERVGEVQERGRADRKRERKVAESRKKTSR